MNNISFQKVVSGVNSDDIVFILDSYNRVIRWNVAFNRVTGFQDKDIQGLKIFDLFTQNDSQELEKYLETSRKNGYASFKASLKTLSGQSIQFYFTFGLLGGKGVPGEDIFAVGCSIHESLFDINNYRMTEAHYHQLFNGMQDGITLWEVIFSEEGKPSDFKLVDLNHSFENLAGITREGLIGKVPGELFSGLRSVLLSVYEKAVSASRTVDIVHYSAEFDRYFKVTAYCPGPNQIVVIFTDITEKQKSREEKKRLQSQLFQAQKMEAIGRLAGGIAHDFNNLLTAIQGYTELAMMDAEHDSSIRENLKQISLATERAAKLANQLLVFSRKEKVTLHPHNINVIIKDLVDMLRRMIGENISIHMDLQPDLWDCKVNKGQIEQVVVNLSVNAKDAMPRGGRLTVKTENVKVDDEYVKSNSLARPGKFVCLSVEDTGIGMDQKTISQIFEPFFTTKKSGEGTGLGLSVVYGIVEEHQGWINVYSEPGGGSVFKIYLPSCSERAEEREESSIDAGKLCGNGERILFVEDDKTICNFVKTQLTRCGYTVVIAENVEKAISLYDQEENGFKLLFTDITLPDGSGIELIETLHRRNPSLKFILTSGYLHEESELPALKDIEVRFIQKPYTFTTILQTIRQTIDVMV
ncbi:MAG: ATP-binding protein [Spirochaetota bacterium]